MERVEIHYSITAIKPFSYYSFSRSETLYSESRLLSESRSVTENVFFISISVISDVPVLEATNLLDIFPKKDFCVVCTTICACEKKPVEKVSHVTDSEDKNFDSYRFFARCVSYCLSCSAIKIDGGAAPCLSVCDKQNYGNIKSPRPGAK